MTPQELRNGILQLAIQGKLVEQRSEEGTGEELYQAIQKKKESLIKDGKIKKSKSLPEIVEDEMSFEIPDNWKWVSLGDVITLLSGRDLQPDDYNAINNGMPYITGASNIDNGEIVINRWTEKPCSIAHSGDLLLTCKGTVGKVHVLKEKEVHIARQLMAITPYLASVEYYMFFLETQIAALKSKAKSMIPGIERKNVLELPCPLPPLAEQKRIVAKIEELMPLVDRYEEAWNRLEALNKQFPEDLQKSILQYAIQGKLVEQYPEEGTGEKLYQDIQKEKQALIKAGKIRKTKNLPEITDDEIPFDVPGSWKWTKLGAIVSVFGGKRIPAGRRLTKENTGYVYIRVSDMKNGSVLTDNLMYVPNDIYPLISKYTINKEDVYITVAGTIGAVGKIPPVLDGANLTENADKLVFSIIDKNWLVKCLESPFIQNQIADATTKVGQPKLAIKRIQELLVPFPPLAEQKRIVAKIEELFPLCEALR